MHQNMAATGSNLYLQAEKELAFCCIGEGTGCCGKNQWLIVGLDVWALCPAVLVRLRASGGLWPWWRVCFTLGV